MSTGMSNWLLLVWYSSTPGSRSVRPTILTCFCLKESCCESHVRWFLYHENTQDNQPSWNRDSCIHLARFVAAEQTVRCGEILSVIILLQIYWWVRMCASTKFKFSNTFIGTYIVRLLACLSGLTRSKLRKVRKKFYIRLAIGLLLMFYL